MVDGESWIADGHPCERCGQLEKELENANKVLLEVRSQARQAEVRARADEVRRHVNPLAGAVGRAQDVGRALSDEVIKLRPLADKALSYENRLAVAFFEISRIALTDNLYRRLRTRAEERVREHRATKPEGS
jgi:hypothetical protein